MRIISSIVFLFVFFLSEVSIASVKTVFNAPPAETKDHMDGGSFLENDLVLGSREAKVVVIEYFALTCPHCSFFQKEVFPKLKEKYIDTNKIAFVPREFIASKQDMQAAVLARCAGDMRRKIFHEVLLEQQSSWAFNRNYTEILTNIGQMGGLAPEKFKECLENEKLGTDLMNNTKLISRTPGFLGTPAFVINNKLYNGKFSFEDLSKEIDSILGE